MSDPNWAISDFSVTVDPSGINKTYGTGAILSLKTSVCLIPTFSDDTSIIGNCSSGQMDLVLKRPTDVTIPKMAKLIVKTTKNNVTTERGTYYIDTREYDSADNTIYNTDTITIKAYDSMLMAEQAYYDEEPGTSVIEGWPKAVSAVVSEIATKLSLTVDTATTNLLATKPGWVINYPGYGDSAYTLREVLGFVGGMFAGNWIMSSDNKLKLIQIATSQGSTATITEYDECTVAESSIEYTSATVQMDDDAYGTAGTTTGSDLAIYIPLLTSTAAATEVATYILSRVTGWSYWGYEAENVMYDPAWSVGTQVTIGRISSFIYSLDIDYDYMLSATLGCPYDNQTEQEYEWKDFKSKTLKKAVRNLTTSLRVQEGEIAGIVSGDTTCYKGSTDPSTLYDMHTGDMWYDTTSTPVWKRWNRNKTWETFSGVAYENPLWASGRNYAVNDKVRYNGEWYNCITAHTSTDSFDNSKWEVISQYKMTIASLILQNIDEISLSVTTDGNTSYIAVKRGGIEIAGSSISMAGTMHWGDLYSGLQDYIDEKMTLEEMNSELESAGIELDTTIGKTYIYSPHIMSGAAGSGFVNISSDGINYSAVSGSTSSNIIGMGYTRVSGVQWPLPTIMLGSGIDYAGTDQGMIKKYTNGIWIGDSDDKAYAAPGGSGTCNGLFVDFNAAKLYQYVNGTRSELGSAVFGA